MATIYGNEFKDQLSSLFPEKTQHDFHRILREVRITLLNFGLWRMEKPWEVGPRQIDDTLLWIIREGKFRCTVGRESLILSKGTGFTAPENTRHAMAFAPGTSRGSVIVIHLKPRGWSGQSPFTSLRTPFFRLSDPEGFFHSMERAIALKNSDAEAAGKLVTARILEMLMDWAEDQLLVWDKIGSCDARVLKAMDFIYRNLSSNIGIADIAEAAGLHEVRFREIFREQTGMTPHSCLKQARLERVCELLVTTLMPLSEIAGQTGFNTASYLCSVFREYSGQSPQDYRKLYQQRP